MENRLYEINLYMFLFKFMLMNNDSRITNILIQIERLDQSSKQILFEKLGLLISYPQNKKTNIKLSSISGLGASIWNNVDIDNYIDGERQW